jgi:osmoprotectant transport system permease protein
LIRHCWLAGSAIGFALLIGLPLGIYLTRAHAVEGPVMSVLNVVQTVPSIALFGLLIAPLSALGKAMPGLGISGIGFAPAVIALTLYALLPIVRNTLAGIAGVDAAIVESARGAGMTGGQILRKVELPLALPIILTGIRIVTVQAIGLAVVAALIGAGGLGTFVFQGLGQYATDLVLLGALPAIALALGADFTLRSVETLLARRPAR